MTTRYKNDQILNEVLEQQAAVSAILDVISNSPGDLQPVFDLIARSAIQLCRARFCAVFQFDGEVIDLVSHFGISASGVETYKQEFPRAPGPETAIGRAILSGGVAHIPDVQADHAYRSSLVTTVDYRSVMAVPMLRDGRPIGGITVLRSVAEPFPERQVELLKTFAVKASIAVETTRLFRGVQESNLELSEALAYQTATSEVLKLITNSPAELQPVFDEIARNAKELCQGQFSGVFQYDGEVIHLVAHHGLDTEGVKEFQKVLPRPPGQDTAIGRAMLARSVIHIRDVQADAEYGPVELARTSGMRGIVAVPMLREDHPAGGSSFGAPLQSRFVTNKFNS